MSILHYRGAAIRWKSTALITSGLLNVSEECFGRNRRGFFAFYDRWTLAGMCVHRKCQRERALLVRAGKSAVLVGFQTQDKIYFKLHYKDVSRFELQWTQAQSNICRVCGSVARDIESLLHVKLFPTVMM